MGKPGALHFNWSSAAMHSSQIKLMSVLCAALLTPPCRFDGAEAAHSIILSTSSGLSNATASQSHPPLNIILCALCHPPPLLLCRFEGAEAAHSIISAGPEPLKSQFTTSYSLVLNLLSVYSLDEAREFLR